MYNTKPALRFHSLANVYSPINTKPHLLYKVVVHLAMHNEAFTTGTVLTTVEERSLDGNGNNLGGGGRREGQWGGVGWGGRHACEG